MVSDLLISRRNSLLVAEVDEEMVGLDIEGGSYYGFNPTAYRIWQLVETPQSLTTLCETLSQEFAIDPATCRDDVRPLLEELAGEGLLSLSRSD